MSGTKNPQYLEVVANAFQAVRAWKLATFTLAGLVVILTFALIHSARNASVILVPFELATSGKEMRIPLNGEIRGTSSEYVANMALSDLSLILNFTPDSVLTQHQRFLNRVTEDLYATSQGEMIAQAKDFKAQNVTQSFFPSDVTVSPDGSTAKVTGTQLRSMAGKEVMRSTLTYIVTYKVFKGYMHVADLRPESKNAKQ